MMVVHFSKKLSNIAVLVTLAGSLAGCASLVPERRENPAKFEYGSMLFPVYSHIPGIGSTYGVGGTATNIFGTRAQVVGVAAGGDTDLTVLGLNEVHLVQDMVAANFYLYSTKIPFQIFDRGIASDPENYLYSINKEYGGSVEFETFFWDRRIELHAQFGASRLQYESLQSADEATYTNHDRSEFDSFNPTLRLVVDLTDDNVDPRVGIRASIIRDQTILYDGLHSRYSTLYGILTGYIPIFSRSTWAFNVFRSSAAMEWQNPASAGQLKRSLALNCDNMIDPTALANCRDDEARRVQDRLLENEYGTAGNLGGPSQLRGFPLSRFRGSQSLFYATEIRFNLLDGDRKFDFGSISGTATSLQIAPFYEIGTVSDPPQTIEQTPFRSSYGIGFRLGFSGALVRADIGFSDEGTEWTFFLGYPWDMSIF